MVLHSVDYKKKMALHKAIISRTTYNDFECVLNSTLVLKILIYLLVVIGFGLAFNDCECYWIST